MEILASELVLRILSSPSPDPLYFFFALTYPAHTHTHKSQTNSKPKLSRGSEKVNCSDMLPVGQQAGQA